MIKKMKKITSLVLTLCLVFTFGFIGMTKVSSARPSAYDMLSRFYWGVNIYPGGGYVPNNAQLTIQPWDTEATDNACVTHYEIRLFEDVDRNGVCVGNYVTSEYENLDYGIYDTYYPVFTNMNFRYGRTTYKCAQVWATVTVYVNGTYRDDYNHANLYLWDANKDLRNRYRNLRKARR